MSKQSRDDCAWRVVFIQPSTPDDDRCVMLYGLNGEIVGPLTLELAEAWMDRFDNERLERLKQQNSDATPQ
jgi:hypothetical protein